ncbi:MAG: efflux RND transporter permease subunit [Planctomycetaceae bacterium]|nr:efflux RND transporter permease subunit [Planctomycetaceae bacterium]
MDPSTLFLRNPRLTLLLIGLILVAGGSSFSILPRMEDPLLTERAAFIITSLPGADAEQIESLVTDPIEDELREIAEIKELRSSSRTSLSTITIELRDDVYADESPSIWSRIRDRVADAEAALPQNASKPRFERIEVTAYTRLIALVPGQVDVSASGDLPSMPTAILRRKAEELRELLLGVPGTKDVEILGDPQEEIRVEIEPDRLAAMGLSVAQVSQLIRASDSRFSAGLLRSSERDLLIEVSGELDSVDRIAAIPVQTSADGRVTLLGDIARVERGIQEPIAELSVVGGQPAIVLACLIRPSQRIDQWNADSRKVTEAFSSRLSRGIRLVDVFSQDGYVTDRLSSLIGNLLLGAASVMLVILVLMGWRSALIVGAALPLSAMMVFAGMNYMGIPIHQMSVTGLIIALGLLIDNAIVVVDEVSQKLRDGDTPVQAVRRTVSHLAVPLFGSTFTTALAFAPIVLMPGPAGEFVGSIAVNVIVAIFSSLALSLSVVPALTGFLASVERRAASRPAGSVWYRDGLRVGWMLAAYQRLLGLVIRRPLVGVLLGVVLPVSGFAAFSQLSEQFFPPADRDQIALEVELPSQSSIAETLATTGRIRDSLLKKDGVEEVTWWVGRSAPPFYYNQIPSRRGMSQYAQALVKLDNADNLRARINQMQVELDAEYPNAQTLVRQLEQGPPFEAPIEVQVFGPDLQELSEISDRLSQLLASLPEVTHIRAEASQLEPRLTLNVDEEQARLLGMTHESVAQQMFSSLEGAVGGMILEGTEELPVRVRVAGGRRTSVDDVESIDVLSPLGPSRSGYQGVPLTALGQVELTPERASVTRLDRRRMTEVQAFLKAGVLPADVLAKFQQLLADEDKRTLEAGLPPVLPPGYQLAYAGEAAQRDDAVGNLMASVATLAVLMVAALVLSFRSFRLASLIGVVAMLAVGLGVGALWVFGHPFGFMAIIGTMGLVGVAINDSIVVLAAIQENPHARSGDHAAILDVVVKATRHVVATSLTTIAGFLPLIIAGGGFWPPMAVTIAGGVGGATILALIFVPACYLLLMTPRFSASSLPVGLPGHVPVPADS